MNIIHYDEEIINGVLCWRKGKTLNEFAACEFTPFTIEQLSSTIVALRSKLDRLETEAGLNIAAE